MLGEAENLLAHAQHPINLGDTEPVEDVRHQSLEPHVLDAGYVFSPLEVIGGPVLASLPRVVDNCKYT